MPSRANIKDMLTKSLSRATSYLPHVKLPIPYRLAPERSLKIYLDSELGLPLNFREPEIQSFFINKLCDYDVLFDIGAHIGSYSILATHSKGLTVHAFEPHPQNVARLYENISHNGLGDRIEAVPTAVGNVNDAVELLVGESDTTHHVTTDGGKGLTVEGVTLDTYCKEQSLYPDILKVDVEGSGELVVEGAERVLERHPDWLVETHSTAEKDVFLNAFKYEGYEISQLSTDHLFATVK